MTADEIQRHNARCYVRRLYRQARPKPTTEVPDWVRFIVAILSLCTGVIGFMIALSVWGWI